MVEAPAKQRARSKKTSPADVAAGVGSEMAAPKMRRKKGQKEAATADSTAEPAAEPMAELAKESTEDPTGPVSESKPGDEAEVVAVASATDAEEPDIDVNKLSSAEQEALWNEIIGDRPRTDSSTATGSGNIFGSVVAREGPRQPLALDEPGREFSTIFCRQCSQPVDPLKKGTRLMSKSMQHYVCGHCNCKVAALQAIFGKWPIEQYKRLSETERALFWQTSGSSRNELKIAVEEQVLHIQAKKLIEENKGKYLPLAVWVNKGWPEELVKGCPSEVHATTGLQTYCVNIHSHSTKNVRELVRREMDKLLSIGQEKAHAARKSPGKSPARSPAAIADGNAGADGEDDKAQERKAKEDKEKGDKAKEHKRRGRGRSRAGSDGEEQAGDEGEPSEADTRRTRSRSRSKRTRRNARSRSRSKRHSRRSGSRRRRDSRSRSRRRDPSKKRGRSRSRSKGRRGTDKEERRRQAAEERRRAREAKEMADARKKEELAEKKRLAALAADGTKICNKLSPLAHEFTALAGEKAHAMLPRKIKGEFDSAQAKVGAYLSQAQDRVVGKVTERLPFSFDDVANAYKEGARWDTGWDKTKYTNN